MSRVYCVPGKYVESVGGETETSLAARDIQHHLVADDDAGSSGSRRRGGAGGSNGLLTHLRSKWSVEEGEGGKQTRVSLSVEFAFSNPLYAALSGNVAPKVAEFMIRAFEKRVREVLERNPEMIGARLGDMDGSRMKR